MTSAKPKPTVKVVRAYVCMCGMGLQNEIKKPWKMTINPGANPEKLHTKLLMLMSST